MRKVFLLVFLIVAIGSMAGNRTGTISTGKTMLDVPMTFSATDTVMTGETVTIIIKSEQMYASKQNMYSTLSLVSGSPSVAIKLFGKCFAGDTYVQIGSTQTWTTTGNNPVNVTAVTPNQYRYFKAEYVCTGTGGVKITAFELKQWLTSGLYSSGTLTDGTATINGGALSGATTGTFSSNVSIGGNLGIAGRATSVGGITSAGATVNLNASSNFDVNINSGTSTGTLSLGGGSGVVTINSSDWDISATGAMTGIGAVTMDGALNNLHVQNGLTCDVLTATADADSTVTSSKLAAIDQFVTVTSDGATKVITLPAAGATIVGMVIRGYVGSNGFELRVATADADTVTINGVTTKVEAAIPATTIFRAECISPTAWILTAVDELGAVITTIVPDAI